MSYMGAGNLPARLTQHGNSHQDVLAAVRANDMAHKLVETT